MNRPRICGVITGNDPELPTLAEPFVDLYEVRLDLIGPDWRGIVSGLKKPWIACNRIAAEGGSWRGTEEERIEELLAAVEAGASIADIELSAPDLESALNRIKKKAQCLISFHDFKGTPHPAELDAIMKRQIAAGADICKIVATAHDFSDSLAVLRLVRDFPGKKVVSFCMGDAGIAGRVLLPLLGGHFTYASLAGGKESAAGQVTAADMRKTYDMMEGAG